MYLIHIRANPAAHLKVNSHLQTGSNIIKRTEIEGFFQETMFECSEKKKTQKTVGSTTLGPDLICFVGFVGP